MKMMGSWSDGLKPVMMMVVVQIAFAATTILYKLAADFAINFKVLVAYRFIFSAAFMVPLALIVERKRRPKLTLVILFQAFLCGLFGGTTAQNLYIESLALTSPTFVAAISNLIPGITFVVAICFRMEKFTLGSHAGRAKMVGTLVGIGGAMLSTFYKGHQFSTWSTHVDLLRKYTHRNSHVASSQRSSGSHLLGSFLALTNCVCNAMWLIVQAKLSKKYPCHYSSTALISIMASIQSAIFTLCTERDWNQWKLGWDVKLLIAAFSGIVTSGLVVVLIAWCVHMRGPLFVSIFNPLSLLLVALAGSLLLDENLNLGSILGGVLIVCGLYMVLWGKSKEMKMMNQLQLARMPQDDQSHSQSIEIIATSPVNIACDNNKNDNTNVKSYNSLSLISNAASDTQRKY